MICSKCDNFIRRFMLHCPKCGTRLGYEYARRFWLWIGAVMLFAMIVHLSIAIVEQHSHTVVLESPRSPDIAPSHP